MGSENLSPLASRMVLLADGDEIVPGLTLIAPPMEPSIRRLTRHPRRFSGLSHTPFKLLNPFYQQPSTRRCQPGRSVTHEGLLEIRGHHTHESNRQALIKSIVTTSVGRTSSVPLSFSEGGAGGVRD